MKDKLEGVMRVVFLLAACVTVLAVLLICAFLLVNGVPAMAEVGLFRFLLGTVWKPLEGSFGILPMILGSIYITAGASLLGIPLGILCAIFLARYCPRRVHRVLKPAVDLLAGIPSIVYGFFGLVVLAPAMQALFGGTGKGILTASVLLAMMILPTVVSMTESALRALPNAYFEGSLALGASDERAIFLTELPAARSGILAGVVLGIGRAMGETMAVVMVAGNQAALPASITDGIRTLSANIVMEMGYAAGLHRESLIATAVVLFVMVLLINLLFSVLRKEDVRA